MTSGEVPRKPLLSPTHASVPRMTSPGSPGTGQITLCKTHPPCWKEMLTIDRCHGTPAFWLAESFTSGRHTQKGGRVASWSRPQSPKPRRDRIHIWARPLDP
jgi:hypothetical protein